MTAKISVFTFFHFDTYQLFILKSREISTACWKKNMLFHLPLQINTNHVFQSMLPPNLNSDSELDIWFSLSKIIPKTLNFACGNNLTFLIIFIWLDELLLLSLFWYLFFSSVQLDFCVSNFINKVRCLNLNYLPNVYYNEFLSKT